MNAAIQTWWRFEMLAVRYMTWPPGMDRRFRRIKYMSSFVCLQEISGRSLTENVNSNDCKLQRRPTIAPWIWTWELGTCNGLPCTFARSGSLETVARCMVMTLWFPGRVDRVFLRLSSFYFRQIKWVKCRPVIFKNSMFSWKFRFLALGLDKFIVKTWAAPYMMIWLWRSYYQ